jgi:NAD(P)-dependent dehydrogenase (short-subunit alcohol dehydrogenase family)
LEGRVVVVTGAGTGIGRSLAISFAGAGATVFAVGRNLAPLQETTELIGHLKAGRCSAVSTDLTNEEGVNVLFKRVIEETGRLDVLLNNAGAPGPTGAIWDISLSDWNATLSANLTAPWLCCREAAKVMVSARSGSIINIGSISGKRPLPKRTPYVASKIGVLGMTRTLAVELGEFGIRVNCISPGAVNTTRLEELAKREGNSVESVLARAASSSALHRVNDPIDIAHAALFLTSDNARNITGQDLTIDGGVWFGG